MRRGDEEGQSVPQKGGEGHAEVPPAPRGLRDAYMRDMHVRFRVGEKDVAMRPSISRGVHFRMALALVDMPTLPTGRRARHAKVGGPEDGGGENEGEGDYLYNSAPIDIADEITLHLAITQLQNLAQKRMRPGSLKTKFSDVVWGIIDFFESAFPDRAARLSKGFENLTAAVENRLLAMY